MRLAPALASAVAALALLTGCDLTRTGGAGTNVEFALAVASPDGRTVEATTLKTGSYWRDEFGRIPYADPRVADTLDALARGRLALSADGRTALVQTGRWEAVVRDGQRTPVAGWLQDVDPEGGVLRVQQRVGVLRNDEGLRTDSTVYLDSRLERVDPATGATSVVSRDTARFVAVDRFASVRYEQARAWGKGAVLTAVEHSVPVRPAGGRLVYDRAETTRVLLVVRDDGTRSRFVLPEAAYWKVLKAAGDVALLDNGGSSWLVNLHDGSVRALPTTGAPALSPDGARVAFLDPTSAVRVLDAQTGAVTALGATGAEVAFGAAGDVLLFTDKGLEVVPPDGRRRVAVERTRVWAGACESVRLFSPSRLADGRFVLLRFLSRPSGAC